MVMGVMFFFVGLTTVILFQNQSQQSQENRSDAALSTGQVEISMTPISGSSLTSGRQNLSFTINTHGKRIDGVQLVFNLTGEGATISNLTSSYVTTTGLREAKTQQANISNGIKVGTIAIAQVWNQPFTSTTSIEYFRISFDATTATPGTIKIIFDDTNSFVTEHGQTAVDLLKIIPPYTYNLTANNGSGTSLTNLGFKVQGLKRVNVTQPVVVTLREKGTTPLREVTTTSNFVSEAGSDTHKVLRSSVPVAFTNFTPVAGKTYEILVTTPTSLRKKLGEMTLQAGANAVPATWSNQVALPIDLNRTTNQANLFNNLDITTYLGQYTQLETPVTDANRKFDLNFDNSIMASDGYILLSNYKQQELRGD